MWQSTNETNMFLHIFQSSKTVQINKEIHRIFKGCKCYVERQNREGRKNGLCLGVAIVDRFVREDLM